MLSKFKRHLNFTSSDEYQQSMLPLHRYGIITLKTPNSKVGFPTVWEVKGTLRICFSLLWSAIFSMQIREGESENESIISYSLFVIYVSMQPPHISFFWCPLFLFTTFPLFWASLSRLLYFALISFCKRPNLYKLCSIISISFLYKLCSTFPVIALWHVTVFDFQLVL